MLLCYVNMYHYHIILYYIILYYIILYYIILYYIRCQGTAAGTQAEEIRMALRAAHRAGSQEPKRSERAQG